VVCARAQAAAFRLRNPEKARAGVYASRIRHPETEITWRTSNKEHLRAYKQQWKRENPHRVAAHKAQRHATRIQRTVIWADPKQIAAHYSIAQKLTRAVGREYHVDHIIPLQGKRVSGLHVQNNLQVIPGIDNRRKQARFEEALWAA
jgi:hypothetical protein